MNKLIKIVYNLTQRIPFIGPRITKQFLRFVSIGSLAFYIAYTINNSLIFLLDSIIKPDEDHIRWIIVIFSYLTAFIFSFTFNFNFSRKWTFKMTGRNKNSQLRKFFVVNTSNALAGATFVTILDHNGISPLVSQPFFIAMQTFWTFFLYRGWVFRQKY